MIQKASIGRRADDGPTLNSSLVALGFFQRIWTSIAIFCDSQGGLTAVIPPPPSGSAHARAFWQAHFSLFIVHS